jgi:hypothetical protein
MAHFAKLDENNYVIAVHVVMNEVIIINGIENEQAGIDFLTNLHGYNLWKQTSYNKQAFAKIYAGIGYYYDSIRDAFIPPKPFPSWTLNEDSCLWDSPVPYPNDGKMYTWNEEILNWQEINLTQ